jgi:hypothetical protein
MVRIIGEVIGRPLRYQEVPLEAAVRALVQTGMPEPLAAGFVANYTRDFGVAATVTGDVKESLDRSALSFADWVADHAELFRAWPPPR